MPARAIILNADDMIAQLQALDNQMTHKSLMARKSEN
jgi:hypothetical protein